MFHQGSGRAEVHAREPDCQVAVQFLLEQYSHCETTILRMLQTQLVERSRPGNCPKEKDILIWFVYILMYSRRRMSFLFKHRVKFARWDPSNHSSICLRRTGHCQGPQLSCSANDYLRFSQSQRRTWDTASFYGNPISNDRHIYSRYPPLHP